MKQVWDNTPWYRKPLLCVFALHLWRVHPGDHTILVCRRCEREERRA